MGQKGRARFRFIVMFGNPDCSTGLEQPVDEERKGEIIWPSEGWHGSSLGRCPG